MTLIKRDQSKLILQKAFLLVFLALTVVGMNITPAKAQNSACDPHYMDALEARAWLEAQREIAQNKNLIAKPDSVLEYVCFDRFVDHLAWAADRMFSGNATIAGVNVNRVGEMADVLEILVANALEEYIDPSGPGIGNFSHDYIDNRIGFGSNIDDNVASVPYACATMQSVWNASQCLNFQDEPRDEFYTFDWYNGNDPRQPPGFCSAGAQIAGYLNVAYNNDPAPYQINNGPIADGTLYAQDPLQTFLNLILPPGAPAGPGGCSAPIPTGVQVERTGFNPPSYQDHVCSNPGCYYNPTGGNCTQ